MSDKSRGLNPLSPLRPIVFRPVSGVDLGGIVNALALQPNPALGEEITPEPSNTIIAESDKKLPKPESNTLGPGKNSNPYYTPMYGSLNYEGLNYNFMYPYGNVMYGLYPGEMMYGQMYGPEPTGVMAYINLPGYNYGFNPQRPAISRLQYVANRLSDETFTKGGLGIGSYAGAKGHLSRREMKRFNRKEGLGMNMAQRAAFRRAHNGNMHAGDITTMNNYWNSLPGGAQLYGMLGPRMQSGQPGMQGLGYPGNETIEAMRTARMQEAWEAYKKSKEDEFNAMSKGFDLKNINSIAKLQEYLDTHGGPDVTWDDAVRNKYQKNLFASNDPKNLKYDDKRGTATNEWITAYAKSLEKAGDYNAFLDKLVELGLSEQDLTALGLQRKTLNFDDAAKKEWLSSLDARNLYSRGFSLKDIDDYNLSLQMQSLKLTFKQGGNLNMNKIKKFLTGGAAPQPAGLEDPLDLIIAVVQAALGGDLKANQMLEQAIQQNELLGAIVNMVAQGLQQGMAPEEIKAQIQSAGQGQAPAAKYGAKLGYIHKLNTGCPAGTELQYYKKGGHICKACVKKAKKAQEGIEVPEEKCGGKAKKYFSGNSFAKKHENGGEINAVISRNEVHKVSKAQNGVWDTVKNYGRRALNYFTGTPEQKSELIISEFTPTGPMMPGNYQNGFANGNPENKVYMQVSPAYTYATGYTEPADTTFHRINPSKAASEEVKRAKSVKINKSTSKHKNGGNLELLRNMITNYNK